MNTILFWQWNSFMNRGIEQALNKLEVAYEIFTYYIENWEEDEIFSEKLETELKKKKYSMVFSVNFCPIIAQVCETNKIRYIAWVYDSPMNIRNLEAMNLSYTSVYIFDRGMVEHYNKQGYRCKHMPLAVAPDVFLQEIRNEKEKNEISFVGKMYQTDYAKYTAFLPEYKRGYLNGLLAVQGKLYGAYLLDEVLNEEFMQELKEEYRKSSDGKIQMEKREFEFLLASEVTSRERYSLLRILANHYKVHIYTDEKNAIPNAIFHDYIDYYTEMPNVFANSKINMNISLKAIRTGIPLRVLDIMGCGGFVLSNYQEELLEYMAPGVDCEVYESIEDAYYKVKFYLENEELRNKIAKNGLEKVKRDFTFEERIKQILEGEREENKYNYTLLQCRKVFDEML